LGIHVTQGLTVNFYEYYGGSPSLLVYIHGTPTAPLYDIGPSSLFSNYPTTTNTTDIPMEKCQLPLSTATIDPPVLSLNTSGFISLDHLTLTWSWPTVYSRKTPTIQLLTPYGPANCTIPPLQRTAPSEDCSEIQSLTFDWVTASSQGCFYATSDVGSAEDTQLQYTGVLRLSTEEVPVTNGIPYPRSMEYDFHVNLLFAEYAEVSGSITMLAPIEIGVTIVGQVHKNTANPPTTYVYIVTEIGYPFLLVALYVNDWVIYPSGLNNNLTTTTMTATDLTSSGYPNSYATEAGTTSSQAWQLEIVPGAGACEVDGIYNGTNVLQISCVDLASTDCDPPVSTGVSMSLSLASENFCGQVVSSIGASLFLIPTDSTFTKGQTALLIAPGAKAYFKLGLSAPPSAGVSITSISVTKVLVNTPQMTQPLAVLISDDTTLDFEVLSSSTDLEIHFSFDTSDNTIFEVSTNSKSTLSVSALATIEYLGVPSSKKRSIQGIIPSSTTSSLVLASIGISAVPGMSTILCPTLGGFMGLVVMLFVMLLG
jgi:hypothetical protein